MTNRRHARDIAFRLLYEMDVNPHVTDDQREEYIQRHAQKEPTRRFARQLVDGVRQHQAELDRRIQECLERWTLSRLGTTERTLLRLGAYELLYAQQPPPVVIAEATRLARRYGDQGSAAFVQGVLNRILRSGEQGGVVRIVAEENAGQNGSVVAPVDGGS